MGCDGGTIPKRDELVKTKKKPEQKDKKSERAFRWKHCAITQQPLQPPVVSCELGRLYSKESVLETLLNKAEGTPAIAAHIRTLKDVKELQLSQNPTWDSATSSNAEVGDAYIDCQKSQWICPVSGQEMNGTFKFCFIWTCGCVLSDKALKELRKGTDTSSECLKCQKPFTFEDVIIINPTEEEDIERQAEKMTTRRALSKKNKKGKKREAETESSVETNGTDKVKVEEEKASCSSSSSAASSNGHKEPSSMRSNGDSSGIPSKKSKFPTSTSSAKAAASGIDSSKKLKGYSVSKDPNASETYKSLFTSHETAQNQQKAHWVTYNPFYN